MSSAPDGPDESLGSDDPLDHAALTSTLNSMLVYAKAAHFNLTTPRRRAITQLAPAHQSILEPYYSNYLASIDRAITTNSQFLQLVAQIGANDFEAPQDRSSWQGATALQVDQTKGTLKQLFRDWSAEAKAERDVIYNPVIDALNRLFTDDERSTTRVLTPGAGLGRLAYEIAAEGYSSQANEFSFHMIIMSNFIINHTEEDYQFSIYPFIHSFSHNVSARNQLREVRIPDVCPSKNQSRSKGDFSFTTGSFVEVYGPQTNASEQAITEKWDAIVTVFFIDTAHNVLDYIDTISYALHDANEKASYWINFGPLLYHFEDEQSTRFENSSGSSYDESNLSVELPLDKLVEVIETAGFVFLELKTGIKASYASDPKAMGAWIYDCVFWVARKRRPGEEYVSFVDRVTDQN
ncbi:putative trehalase [Myxozyma melibiosi]|uniref:carnosine N-methyltransferase n=1 Tax=Myxozyma melibiosi TaxID=54550 RepID=A0ABR1F3H3_9ASCO